MTRGAHLPETGYFVRYCSTGIIQGCVWCKARRKNAQLVNRPEQQQKAAPARRDNRKAAGSGHSASPSVWLDRVANAVLGYCSSFRILRLRISQPQEAQVLHNARAFAQVYTNPALGPALVLSLRCSTALSLFCAVFSAPLFSGARRKGSQPHKIVGSAAESLAAAAAVGPHCFA